MIETFRWGPSHTPKLIRFLMTFTCVITLLSALTNSLFVELLGIQGPQFLLGLSATGLQSMYYWQPITYLFIQDVGSYGVHIFFLLTLGFNMYILWVIGSMVYERTRGGHLLGIYFGSGIAAGLISLLFMHLWHQYFFLAGPSAALLGLFVVWVMYYPDNDLYFFFLIPLKPKTLLTIILSILFISNLSNLDFISMLFYLVAALVGYLYGLLFLGLRSPYLITHRFDREMIKLINRFRGIDTTESKIVDISGVSQDDDRFVDAMLTKISKFGESSLTQTERRRMKKISEEKMKNR